MRTLMTTLALAALAAAPVAAAPTAEDLMVHVPPASRTVLAVDGAALRAHPLVQEFLQQRTGRWAGAHGEVEDFLAEAGLDPLRDVDTVVVALIADGPNPQGVMLIGGSFSPDRINGAIAARGAVATSIAGHPAFRVPGSDASAPEGPVFVLLSPELAVLGDARSVADVVAPRVQASGMLDAEVAAGRLDVRSQFWLVTEIPARTAGSPFSEGADGGGAMAGVQRAAGAVTRFGMAGSIGNTVALRGWALTDTSENAELLQDAARGAVAAVRLQSSGSNPELLAVLRDMDIRTRDRVVHIAAELPAELLEKLFRDY